MPKPWGYSDKVRIEIFDRWYMLDRLEHATGVKQDLSNGQVFRDAIDVITYDLRWRLLMMARQRVEEMAASMAPDLLEKLEVSDELD